MDINVYVESVLTPQSFVKRDNSTMTRYSFVGVVRNGQYQKRVCFTCLGDDRWKNLGIVVGCEYNVSFDLESREFNGRWYTDVVPWKAIALNVPRSVQQVPQQQVQYQPLQGYVPQQPMVQQQGYVAQQAAPQPQVQLQQPVPQQTDNSLPF